MRLDKKYIFFVSSLNEAKKTQDIIKSLNLNRVKIVIISSSPYANIFYENINILYKDVSTYFPNSIKVRVMFKKLNGIITAWYHKYNKKAGDNRIFQQIGFSLHNYLGELEHSLATAENIINIEKPDKLYLTKYWSETPFRRYQTENFYLYNLALIKLSKKRGIAILNLENHSFKTLPIHLFLFSRTIFLSSSKISFRQIFRRAKLPALKNLTIMANYYQLENLIPLMDKLKNKSIKFSLIGNADLKQRTILNKKGIDFYAINDLEMITTRLFDIRMFKLINMFLFWGRYRKEIRIFFNKFDRNYWDFISPKFLYYCLYDFPLISDLMTNSQKIFGGKDILLTMATTDTISHSISYAAKLSQLNVLELQHGMLFTDVDKVHRLNDYYILWGRRARDIITDKRSILGKYPITGFPLFDKYNKINSSKLRPIIRKKISIHSKTKVILILAVFPTGLARINQNISPFEYIDMIFQTVNNLNGKWKIIFRPHPSFESGWIINMAKKRNIDLYYDNRKFPIEESIAVSDIVIANLTTPILDAMFLKKPVLTFLFHYDLADEISNSFLAKSKATVLFSNQNELRKYIDLCLNNLRFQQRMLLGQKKFLQEYCMAFSGSSTVRTSKIILDILQA